MPFYQICLSAETEGVASIQPARPRQWGLKVICDNCRETSPHFIYVDESEERDSGGGGTRNAVFKCAFCKCVITISIGPGSYGVFTPDGDDNAILAIEVRGGAPEELELDDGWVVEAEGGASFTGVNIAEDWMDCDETSGVPVSVSGASVEFRRAKRVK